MKVQAVGRNLQISAQKLRVSVSGLSGQSVTVAMQQLSVRPQKGAIMAFDVVKSAVANAENNNNAQPSQLVIDEIRVDQATKLKRWRPRSRGMTAPIEHQRAHLMVVLSDQPKPKNIKAKVDKPKVSKKVTKKAEVKK